MNVLAMCNVMTDDALSSVERKMCRRKTETSLKFKAYLVDNTK
jgi:hypothetical protein